MAHFFARQCLLHGLPPDIICDESLHEPIRQFLVGIDASSAAVCVEAPGDKHSPMKRISQAMVNFGVLFCSCRDCGFRSFFIVVILTHLLLDDFFKATNESSSTQQHHSSIGSPNALRQRFLHRVSRRPSARPLRLQDPRLRALVRLGQQ